MRIYRLLFFLCIFVSPRRSDAQIFGVGGWREHLPYSNAIQVVISPTKIWCATRYSVFSLDKTDNEITRWSKVNGLTETGVNAIAWDETTSSLVIAYSNSGIDILNSTGVRAISALKNATQPGNKIINQIYIVAGRAYLSTGLGIVVVDVASKEVKETYVIGSVGSRTRVNAVTTDAQFIYAATEEGLKKAALNGPNLSDYRNWTLITEAEGIPAGNVANVLNNGSVIVALKNDTLFAQAGNAWSLFYRDGFAITHIQTANNKILLSESQNNSARVVILTAGAQIENILQHAAFIKQPRLNSAEENVYWIADESAGLSKFENNNFQSYLPNSPTSVATGEMVFRDGALWVAAGTVTDTWQPTKNKNGLFKFENDLWTNFNAATIPAFDSLPDIITVAIDRSDKTVWGGSFGGGLVNLNNEGKTIVYKQTSPLLPPFFATGEYRIGGLAFDSEENLWISNYSSARELHRRKKDGDWNSFDVPFPIADNAVGKIVIDELDQKWIVAPNGQGLIVFNHGATIENPGDDRWKWYLKGIGNGNLPDNNVLSIAKDKNNFIWVGTSKGIGIIQCPQEIFSTRGCEAILPVVQQDNFAGYLFSSEKVQCIAVDGADRKWIGTKNGVWLISSDAEKTISRFTVDNSPLPDNDVRQIAINGINGEVFLSTMKGIVSYRGTATEANENNSPGVLVFPNPVPPGYNGTIAIRGVPANSIVKITELDGRLVYQTKAQGGQATWNGKNYKGQTIATGIYLLLISDETKQEKMVGKIVFIGR
ncbi:MAG: T9SS type A sorting domain-containing protein [Chitinophagaceae bacterium]|nr:T9SS type A sorting domain-containing protein [Chitinophagaceae bacterium]